MSNNSDIKVIAIAAMDESRVIGYQQTIPWHIPGEQKHFAKLTKGHSVLMGRKTYDSLPDPVRPLPKRKNIVVSRSASSSDYPAGVDLYPDLDQFFSKLRGGELEFSSDLLWVIGGEAIYRQALPYCDEICLTLVKGEHEGDTYFPEFEKSFNLYSEESIADTHSIQWYRRGVT